MSRTIQDCYEGLATAQDLPWGQARTSLTEEIVAAADTLGDRELAIDARLELASAYQHGGEPLKQLPVFSWLLARHDEEPLDEVQLYHLLWEYKAIPYDATQHPDIPLAVVTATVDDMQRRYTDEGEGLAPVLGARYEVAAHVHGYAAAEDDYLAWIRAPRTQLSDCAGCEPTTRVEHLAATGRHDDAVAEAFAVLADLDDACENQPASIIAKSLASMLVTGHAAQAASMHLRGIRQTRRDPGGLTRWADHLDVLARAGRLHRAADLMAERLHELESPSTPLAGMVLAASASAVAARLDDAGRGDLVITPRRPTALVPEPLAAADLVAPLRAHALALAARFDARNGTTAVSERIALRLDPAPLPDLPLDALAGEDVVPRRGRRAAPPVAADPILTAPTAAGTGTAPAAASAAPRTLADFAAVLDAVRTSGHEGRQKELLELWRSARAGLVADAAGDDLTVARLDWVAAADDAERDPATLPAAAGLGARLLAAGGTADATRFELWHLRARITAGVLDPEAGAEAGENILAAAETELTPAGFASAAYLHLGVLQAAAEQLGTPGAVQAAHDRAETLVAQAVGCLDRVADEDLDGYERGCFACLLRVKAQLATDPTEQRVALQRAHALLPAGVRGTERAEIALDLAAMLADDDDLDGALRLLADAEPDAVGVGNMELATRVAGSTAQLLVQQSQTRAEAAEGDEDAENEAREMAAAAVTAAQRAVRHAENGTGGTDLDQARRSLVQALRGADRTLEAAEVAELAYRDAHTRLVASGLTPMPRPEDWPDDADDVQPRLDVHLAGALAWAAAITAEALDEDLHAHELAVAGARWHARNANPGPLAEVLEIAARTAPDAADAARLWAATAQACTRMEGHWAAVAALRSRLLPLASAEGAPVAAAAAKGVHMAVEEALAASGDDPDALTRALWEHCVVDEHTARILAEGGGLEEGLQATEGLAARYRELGDLGSVCDVAALRGRILDALDRFDEAEAELRAAIDEVAEPAPIRAAALAGLLAALLDDADREDDAAALREQFDLN